MAKLNQIIAVCNGKKTQSDKALTDIYHKLQKDDLFNGLERFYQPLDEDGETQPPEHKKIQYTVGGAVEEMKAAMQDLLDIILTQDVANTEAKADVSVDGQVIMAGVPVTHLLWLEKTLVNLNAFVSKLPTLDTTDDWRFDESVNFYVNEPSKTNRSKKVRKNHVLASATDKHPAQVEVYLEDVKVGEWTAKKFSGAMPAKDKEDMLRRVKKLQDAVKYAREEANNYEVKIQRNDSLLTYIIGA